MNVVYHSNYLTVEAGRNYASFEDSRIPNLSELKARVKLKRPEGELGAFVDGKQTRDFGTSSDGMATVITDLKPVREASARLGWFLRIAYNRRACRLSISGPVVSSWNRSNDG